MKDNKIIFSAIAALFTVAALYFTFQAMDQKLAAQQKISKEIQSSFTVEHQPLTGEFSAYVLEDTEMKRQYVVVRTYHGISITPRLEKND